MTDEEIARLEAEVSRTGAFWSVPDETVLAELKRLRGILARAHKWLSRPYSGEYFDGGESADWETLGAILDGDPVELEGSQWVVREDGGSK